MKKIDKISFLKVLSKGWFGNSQQHSIHAQILKSRGYEKLANKILDSTPIMSESIKDTREAIGEVYELTEIYKDDKKKFNEEAIKLFLRYYIITPENVEVLRKRGKID